MRDTDLASWLVGNLRDHYEGVDYVEDALVIADIVCGSFESNDDAETLIIAVGYVLGIVLDWKEASPETIGKVQAIRRIALPGMDELPEPNRKQQAGMLQ
jgi:hypothetical protein